MEQNQSVSRALALLEALSRASDPQGVRDLARAVGLAPSIAQRQRLIGD